MQARDACYERPWQEAGSSAHTVTVTLSAFEELQHHIDKANGPTSFIVKSKQPTLVAKKAVQIIKPDITITAAAEFLSRSSSDSGSGSGSDAALQLAVDCALAGSLLHVRWV